MFNRYSVIESRNEPIQRRSRIIYQHATSGDDMKFRCVDLKARTAFRVHYSSAEWYIDYFRLNRAMAEWLYRG